MENVLNNSQELEFELQPCQLEWPTLSGHSAYFGLSFLIWAREGFQTVFPGLYAKQFYFYLSGFHVRFGL